MPATAREKQKWIAALGVPLLLLALYPLQRNIAGQRDSISAQKRELLLRSGKLLRKLSLGYDALLADIYWTRTVQYNGGVLERGESDFSLLAPLLDVTTDLDPRLDVAFQYGAIFLSEKVPAGAGRPDQAIALERKGIALNPSNYRLYYNLGFVYYWYLRDYKTVAQTFWEGSKVPGAMPWMSRHGRAHRRIRQLEGHFPLHVVGNSGIHAGRQRPRQRTGSSASPARRWMISTR